jgi:protoheme IX farnesyltransferase
MHVSASAFIHLDREMLSTLSPVTPPMNRLRWLALAAALAALVWTVLGGLARANSSGAGCVGVWPLCNGQWSLRLTGLDGIEVAHRLMTALTGLLTLVLAALAGLGQRRVRWIAGPTGSALGWLGLQFMLGFAPSHVIVTALHFAAQLALLAALLIAMVVAFRLPHDARLGDSLIHLDQVSGPAGATMLALLALLVVGVVVSVLGIGPACTAWPPCDSGLWPSTPAGWLNTLHRVLALAAGGLLLVGVRRAWRWRKDRLALLTTGSVTAALFGGQALIGAANVLNGFPLNLVGLHAATSVLIWAGAVVFTVLALQLAQMDSLPGMAAPPLRLRLSVGDYAALTKPIVTLLLLATTAAAMVVAGHDWPPLDLFLWTMLGGGLASGGASALNQVIDHDLDKFMTRTARRPLAQGRLSLAAGLSFGLILTIAGFYVLAVFVNLAAAFWAMVGSGYYVLGYSLLLKKSTVHNIVIGGGAGAIPPLVGWAAVTGGLSMPAWFLFALVFFWTPPHFWALSLVKKNDYARAGVPMLPVVWGEAETRRQIVWYTLVMVALSLLLAPARVAGLVYLLSAGVLGLGFLGHALWLWRSPSNKMAWRMYKYSSLYLALIFAALVADRFFYWTV